MNKNEVVTFIAGSAELTKVEAGRAVDAFIEAIEKTLKKKEEVRLVGFGTFYVSKRAATKGRNPRTGAAISIPASLQPRFKPGKSLKDAIS
ncbi:MAG: HU family DNA-binding protein [Holosporales bacterium]|jgi:DNA-binding protein HU-beta|nr:HU family DNA-binding protein [Holosporales bacterium]